MPPDRRLDLIATTGHDRHVVADYRRVQALGIRTVRDGLRWHLIEPSPGRYDFSSVLPMLRAARATGTQVIWDLCHYGWPDDIDPLAPAFVDRFARFARRVTAVLADETDGVPFVAPINEISFLSWAAGEVGHFHPFAVGRGYELKVQLARAVIAGCAAIREVCPGARLVHTDPVIHVVADVAHPEERTAAEAYRQAQYEAWDMLCGRREPQRGGRIVYLDILGVNYYPHNQWVYAGSQEAQPLRLTRVDPRYRPFGAILREVARRYGRPLFVAETAAHDAERVGWLRSIGREVRAALRAGVPVHGICLYPVLNFPDWYTDVHMNIGLWDRADAAGDRELYRPLAREVRRQGRLRWPQALLHHHRQEEGVALHHVR